MGMGPTKDFAIMLSLLTYWADTLSLFILIILFSLLSHHSHSIDWYKKLKVIFAENK